MRIKLLSQGFEDYTGPLGPVMFKDGTSVEPVSYREAIRIGSAFKVVFEDGTEISAASEILDGSKMSAPIVTEAKRLSDVVVTAEEPVAPEAGEPVTGEPENQTDAETLAAEQPPVAAEGKLYSREHLEAVADSKGISGLREIGEQHGVTAKSIEAMIERLMQVEG